MWDKVSLADVLDFREGPGILAKDFREDGTPLIRLSGLKGGSVIAGCNFLDEEDVARRWSQFRLQSGDTLLSTSASLGEVATVDEAGIGAVPYTGLIRFRPKDDRVARAFIPLMLRERSFKDQIEAMGVGSVMKHFGPSHLRQMSVTVPPVSEQEAIAEVLGALDDKIASNDALSASGRSLALAMLPGDGPTRPLGEIVTHRKRQIEPSTIPGTIVDHYSLPAFDAGGGPETVEATAIKSGKFLIERPSILVSKLNPRTPRVWPVATSSARQQLASTEFLVLEPQATNPWQMWAILSRPGFSSALEGMVSGTSGSHQRVRPVDILATHVLDPGQIKPRLLEEIGHVLAPLDSLLAENRTLAATRDVLLPQLMSGKLRVRDAERIASDAGL